MRLRIGRILPIALVVLALCAASAPGTTIRDLVRIKGHERNVLTGMGIVIGLNGTGDTSKDSLVAARPYGELLRNLGNPIDSIDELAKADSYAIVAVTLNVPAAGVREGDRLDIAVDTLFNAESLEGGRLVVSFLRPPLPDSPDLVPLAYAEGPLVIESINPRSGIVRGGAQMLEDIRTNPVTAAGTMTLVLEHEYAGYPEAVLLARMINDYFGIAEAGNIAVVEDAKNIRIDLPPAAKRNPAAFIAALEQIPVDPSLIETEARIVINEKQGIILVTGNVSIGPVAITHRGLTITSITPEPVPDARNPQIDTTRWTQLDTSGQPTRRSARLTELLQALRQLNVPVEDQIAIIHELAKTGSLHAEIINQ